MKTGVERSASGSAARVGFHRVDVRRTLLLVSVVAIVQKLPIGYHLSPLRERPSPVAGHHAPTPRESFRKRLVNVTIFARPRRSVGRGYV